MALLKELHLDRLPVDWRHPHRQLMRIRHVELRAWCGMLRRHVSRDVSSLEPHVFFRDVLGDTWRDRSRRLFVGETGCPTRKWLLVVSECSRS